MFKAAVTLAVLALGFSTMFVGSFPSARAQPSAQIRITSVGDVDPATAPIEHVGDFFRLTANRYNILSTWRRTAS
jgi:hypothetical protein